MPQPRTQALGTSSVERGILAGGAALGVWLAHALEPEPAAGVLAEV